METLSKIIILLGAIGVVVAIILRAIVQPLHVTALPINASAIGQLCALFFLFAIAVNTLKKG